MASLLEILAVCEWNRIDDDNVTIVKQENVRSCSVSAPEITFVLAAEIGVTLNDVVLCSTKTGVPCTAILQAGVGPTNPVAVIVSPGSGAGAVTPDGSFVVFRANVANIPSA